MKNYKPIMSFGENDAERYDDYQRGDESAVVAFLEQLAGGGPALELAIGTSRIGLPLAARGIRVDGIDISPAMVEQLRAKPGGDEISVTIGDFADVPVVGTYRLVYVVFNTLFNLLTQEDQVRCFKNVAAHLTEDGSFVVEAGVPDFLYRLRDHQYVDAEAIEVDEVQLDVARYDPVKQFREAIARREPRFTLPRGRTPESNSDPVRMAQRVRSHGAYRRAAAEGTMGRLAARALHLEPQLRVRLQTLSGHFELTATRYQIPNFA